MRDDVQRLGVVDRRHLDQFFVAAHVIAVHVRVDDVAQRAARQLVHLRHDLGDERAELGIHQQHALLTHLHGHVAPRAHQHVDIAPGACISAAKSTGFCGRAWPREATTPQAERSTTC